MRSPHSTRYELRLFKGQGILRTLTIHAFDIAVVGTIFNVFSYDALSDRDSNLSSSRRRADALRVNQGRGYNLKCHLIN